jgi:hypothetical protein
MEWRHNLAGRPALDIVGLAGFWIGLAMAVWHFAKPRYLLLLLWLGANLLSTLLSTEAPHFLRSIGALPAIVMLSADGLTTVWKRLVPRLGWWPLLIGVVAFGGLLTYHDYFDVWAAQRETFDAFDGPVETIAHLALTLSETTNVVLPLRIYGTPNMQFYLAGRFPHGVPSMALEANAPAVWLTAGGVDRSVVVLGQAGAFFPQPLDDQKLARVRDLIKSGQPVKGPFGQTLGTELPLANVTELVAGISPKVSLDANFGGQVRMFGYDIEPTTVAPGGKIRITYYWQALRDVKSDYFVTSNLLDPFGEAFGQTILEPVSGKYPTSLWQRGAIIPDSFEVQVPKDAHPGKYRFEVGLLNRIAFDQLLPLLGAQDRLFLNPITVAGAPVNPNAISHPLAVRFGDPAAMTLIGYDLARATVRAGEPLQIKLYWRAERSMAKDYSLFLHLVDGQGQLVAQQDSAPANGNAPTLWWQPGDQLPDEHELVLPAGLPAGAYVLELGVYDSANGMRLPLLDAAGVRLGDDRWQIPIQVTGS